jgi:hypothetical protein
MTRTGRSLVAAVAVGGCLMVAWLGGLTAAQDAPQGSSKSSLARVRIGVYDSRAIAVSSRDTFLKNQTDNLIKERDQARARGDTKKISALEKRGANLQTLRHLQAFSNGPVDDIIAFIVDEMPAIAKNADVIAITSTTDFHADNVELVDITDEIVKAFHPKEATLKIVSELRKQKPLPLVDVIGQKD